MAHSMLSLYIFLQAYTSMYFYNYKQNLCAGHEGDAALVESAVNTRYFTSPDSYIVYSCSDEQSKMNDLIIRSDTFALDPHMCHTAHTSLSHTSQMRSSSPQEHLYSEPIIDFAASTPDSRTPPQAFTAHSLGPMCSQQSPVVLEHTYSTPLTLQLSPDTSALAPSPVTASGVPASASAAPAVSKSAPASPGIDTPIVATVRHLVDHRGGVLESRETGVSLTVPPGALPASAPRELFFHVCRAPSAANADGEVGQPAGAGVGSSSAALLVDSSKQERLVSPLVVCGPRGTVFQRPVELRMPHSANLEQEQWALSLRCTDSTHSPPAAAGGGPSPPRASTCANTHPRPVLLRGRRAIGMGARVRSKWRALRLRRVDEAAEEPSASATGDEPSSLCSQPLSKLEKHSVSVFLDHF